MDSRNTGLTMPLAIDDGYTLEFRTPAEVTDAVTGRVVESGLTVVTGRYRPPLLEDIQTYRYDSARAASGKEQALAIGRFVCDRVTDWDVVLNGKPFPIEAATFAAKMPDLYASLILNEVMKWSPKPGESQEKARGNS